MVAVMSVLAAAEATAADLTDAEAVEDYCERVSPYPPEAVVESWTSPCAGIVRVRPEEGVAFDAEVSEEGAVVGLAEGVVAEALRGAAALLCAVEEPETERVILSDWIRERHGRLLAVHHLDVEGPDLELHEDLGLVVVRHGAMVEAGGGDSRLWLGGEGRMAFEAGQALQDEIQRLDWLGDLVLRLEVVSRSVEDAAVPGGRVYCTPWEGGRGWDIHGRVTGAALLDGTTGEELVRAGGVARDAGVPVAEVTGLDVEGEQSCPPREAGLIRLAVEGLANRCYAESLLTTGLVRGAVVLEFEVSAEGRADGVRVLIDVLQHSPLTTCLVSELSRARLPRLEGGGATRLRVALTFSMESGEGTSEPVLASPGSDE